MPLPEPFKNEREFLKNFETHSKTSRASFSINQINYLYELAGEEALFSFESAHVFRSLRYNNPETRKLLRKARKNISEKERKLLEFNVLYLDPYRENNNNISYLDDYR